MFKPPPRQVLCIPGGALGFLNHQQKFLQCNVATHFTGVMMSINPNFMHYSAEISENYHTFAACLITPEKKSNLMIPALTRQEK